MHYTDSNFRLSCQAETIDLELRWKRGHMAHAAKAEIAIMTELSYRWLLAMEGRAWLQIDPWNRNAVNF